MNLGFGTVVMVMIVWLIDSISYSQSSLIVFGFNIALIYNLNLNLTLIKPYLNSMD